MQQLQEQQYDVIIIGAGVGGLTAGALLSKAGLSVCIIEKEPHAGGYLAGFHRKDFRFDTAIHWLNQCSQEGMVTKVFSLLGNNFPRPVCQQRIRRYQGEQHHYLLTNNPGQLKEQWIREFPEDQKGIERFFKAAWKISVAFQHYSQAFRSEETMNWWQRMKSRMRLLRFSLAFIPHLRYSGKKGIQKGLANYFTSARLKEVFSADTEILSCLVPISWAYNNDYQSPPAGGGRVIPEWLQHVIDHHGQKLYCGYTVKQITLQGNVATGVVAERNGKQYRLQSKYVIAACDARMLYEKMLPQTAIPEKIKSNLRRAELYSSSVTISVAIDCPVEELGFNEELVHISSLGSSPLGHIDVESMLKEIVVLAPSFRDRSLAPEGKGTLVFFVPAYMDFEKEWRTEKDVDGRIVRGEAYKALKETVAVQVLQKAEEKLGIELQKHILFYDVATPVTHWRYTGNEGGSMMGAKPGRFNMQNKVARYQTPVKNLLIGGHWAELGGGVPIAVKAGMNASLLVLKKENTEAFRLLTDYLDNKIDLDTFQRSPLFAAYNGQWQQKPTPAQKKQQQPSETGTL